MPSDDALDEMAQKIAGCDFAELTAPEHKARVMELALLADLSYDLSDIRDWFKHSRLFDGLQ